jgi:hypothetical protein
MPPQPASDHPIGLTLLDPNTDLLPLVQQQRLSWHAKNASTGLINVTLTTGIIARITLRPVEAPPSTSSRHPLNSPSDHVLWSTLHGTMNAGRRWSLEPKIGSMR